MLRAKYRVQDEKERTPFSILGAHPFYRAGLYPMEETVMNLGLSILSGGFSVDEASHEGVCVQEVPQAEPQNTQWFPDMTYEPYLAYNIKKTESVEALATTFSKTTPHFMGRCLTATCY